MMRGGMANTFERGQRGKEVVIKWLKAQKFKIVDANAKTPRYEIDIIANRQRTLYFVEVKLRTRLSQGGGFEYVTPRKLQQMKFAAESWVAANDYSGVYKLAAASVDGDSEEVEFTDEIWLENIQ